MPSCVSKLTYILRLLTIHLLVLLFFVPQTFSQTTVFIPAPDDIIVLKSLATQFEITYERETSGLPPQNRKEMKEMYKLRHDNIKAKFVSNEIYTSAVATAYLQKLVNEIMINNPLLIDKNIHCFFSKSGIPNASYLGEGMIIFNMGLFEKLENESQAAFILCHEIAHFYLHHSENSIQKYVTTINSTEVQRELRNIKRSQFNKRTDLEKLLKDITFDSRHHTRDHESQADSMAVEFLHNTGFDVLESLSTLDLLDSIDIDKLEMEECLLRNFDAPEYKFQKKWLARETGLLGGHAIIQNDPLLNDSLKTHPDCKLRISYIEPLVMKYNSPQRQQFLVDKAMFGEMKILFEYEIAAYPFLAGNYSKSLFYTLELLEKKPADPYLVTQIGQLFNALYAAQKKHVLGKLVDLPSPAFTVSYNILLQFINNLYLEEFAAISSNYLRKYRSTLHSYAPYLIAYNTSIDMAK